MITNMPTTMKEGQYVELTELPPIDPTTGASVPGLMVGTPGVIRRVGHDVTGAALVCVEFHHGAVWVRTTSVRAIKVAQDVPS